MPRYSKMPEEGEEKYQKQGDSEASENRVRTRSSSASSAMFWRFCSMLSGQAMQVGRGSP